MDNYPRHIGIILDGNRRYAKEKGIKPWEGHRHGAENILKLFEHCKELNIHEVTMYAFSLKNFERNKLEVEFLFKLFHEFFEKLIADKDKLTKSGMRINFLGRIELFPDAIKKRMKELMEITKDNTKYIANFAMAYDGHAEVVDSVKEIGKKIESGDIKSSDINEKMIQENLYNNSPIDMIIRTSGEYRISGFMLWFSSYAEFFFLDKFWPEFSKEDLKKCIDQFVNRDRRFGK